MPRFSSSKSFEQVKKPRKLSERSHLAIEFPQTDGRVFRTYVPFLSNPTISERGQANLIEYDLVGRAGSTYSYGGAKSRVIQLQFQINLLHTMYTDSSEGIDEKFFRQFNLFFSDKKRATAAFKLRPGGSYARTLARREGAAVGAAWDERDSLKKYTSALLEQQNDFDSRVTEVTVSNYDQPFYMEGGASYSTESDRLSSEAEEEYDAAVEKRERADKALAEIQSDIAGELDLTSNRDPDIEVGKGFPHSETHRAFYREMLALITGQPVADIQTPAIDGVTNAFLDTIGADTIPTPQENMNRLNKLMDAIFVWVNLIRGSVLNNSRNTTLGPPIVRLQHGPMYNNVPFVVSDYNISIDDRMGYELETLTPKGLNVQMTLKEYRTNGTFNESEIESGDHIAGWEAIIGNNNIDSYNGDIGQNVLGTQQYALKPGGFDNDFVGSVLPGPPEPPPNLT